jgi:hypothetical protein
LPLEAPRAEAARSRLLLLLLLPPRCLRLLRLLLLLPCPMWPL